jgi:hypothetical protein
MTETSFSANQQRFCFLAARREHTYTNIQLKKKKRGKRSQRTKQNKIRNKNTMKTELEKKEEKNTEKQNKSKRPEKKNGPRLSVVNRYVCVCVCVHSTSPSIYSSTCIVNCALLVADILVRESIEYMSGYSWDFSPFYTF